MSLHEFLFATSEELRGAGTSKSTFAEQPALDQTAVATDEQRATTSATVVPSSDPLSAQQPISPTGEGSSETEEAEVPLVKKKAKKKAEKGEE